MYSSCEGTLDEENSIIKTPNYPEPYNIKEICIWRVVGPCGSQITLEFYDFDLEVNHDYLYIDGSRFFHGTDKSINEKIEPWHRFIDSYNANERKYYSKSNVVDLEFWSDCAVNYRGFKIRYEIKGKANRHNRMKFQFEISRVLSSWIAIDK